MTELLPYLVEELAHTPLWGLHTIRQDLPDSPHADTQTIFLRGPSAYTHSESLDAVTYHDTVKQLPACGVLLAHLMASGPALFGRAALVKLRAGGKVKEHTDYGPYAEYYRYRLHFVIQSAPGNKFYHSRGVLSPNPGDCFSFDHLAPHSVVNDSDTDRIHLILDIRK